jgi:hypothetical protein
MNRLLTLSLLLVTAVSQVHAAQPVQDFVGSFAPANWTSSPGDGSIAFDATSLSLTSGNLSQASFTDVSINVPFAVRVSFDWNYATDDFPEFDPFGITTLSPSNAPVFTALSNVNGNDVQSGNFSMLLSAGDLFAFTALSIDGIGGAATTRITNFAVEQTGVAVPEPSTVTLLLTALAAGAAFRRRWV